MAGKIVWMSKKDGDREQLFDDPASTERARVAISEALGLGAAIFADGVHTEKKDYRWNPDVKEYLIVPAIAGGCR